MDIEMKKMVMLAIVMVTMLVSLGGCYIGPWHDRGEYGHDNGRRGHDRHWNGGYGHDNGRGGHDRHSNDGYDRDKN